MHRAQGKPQPDAHGWRELEGETAKPERVNDRKITADGKEGPGDRSGEAYPCIPASPAKMEARQARTRHGGHITEIYKAMPRMAGKGAGGDFLCLCPGTGRKRRDLPASVIISGFLPGYPPCCGFRSGLPDHLPQNTTVKPAAGGSSGIRSTSQASPQDRYAQYNR